MKLTESLIDELIKEILSEEGEEEQQAATQEAPPEDDPAAAAQDPAAAAAAQTPPDLETDFQELPIDIPDSPFEPDASQITSRLKQILVKWKDHVYPDDTSRSHNYYHDIETLVNQIQKHKGDDK